MDKTEMITIKKEEFDRLWDRDQLLCALESTGVDNWDGWCDAHELVKEWNKEEIA